jgi:uncharacterized protein YjdB
MTGARRWISAWRAVLLTALSVGCIDDRTTLTAPIDAPVRLALNATILEARAGQTVHIRAFYRRVNGTEITLVSSPTSVSVTPGVPKQVGVVVRVAECLSDPQQAGGTRSRCAVVIALSLEDETGTVIDVQTADPTQPLQPGSTATLQPITFTPVAQVTLGTIPVLREGDNRTFTASALDGQGRPLTSKPIQWVSDNPNIIRVNPTTGAATALAIGSARVTATSGAKNASTTVRVIRRVASVLVSPDPAPTLLAAASLTVVPTPKAADGTDAGDMSDRVITWSVANPAGANATASVSTTGVVTGVYPGDADVTVTVDGIPKTVRVRITAANIAVKSSTTIVVVGTKLPFQALVLDAKNGVIPNVPVTWSSSDLTAATVDATGMVTAVGQGLSIITATGGGVSGTGPLHVTTLALDIEPKTSEIIVGDSVQLRGTNEIGTITWATSNSSIATVSASGLVTGKAPGTVTINGTTTSIYGVQTGSAEVVVIRDDSLGFAGSRRAKASAAVKPSPRE